MDTDEVQVKLDSGIRQLTIAATAISGTIEVMRNLSGLRVRYIRVSMHAYG